MSEVAVNEWLHSLGLSHYTQSFLDNGYDDLDVCRQIGEPDLDAIGVLDEADRRQVFSAVAELIRQYDNEQRSVAASSLNRADGGLSANSNGPTGSCGTPVYFTLENPNYSRLQQTTSINDGAENGVQITPFWSRTAGTSGVAGDLSAAAEVASPSSVPETDLCTYPRGHLLSLIRDRLVDDGVKLNEEPYLLEVIRSTPN